jgi:hypothetical protein
MKHVESGIDIDVTFGGLLFEQAAIDNSKVHDIGGLLAAHPEADVTSVRRTGGSGLQEAPPGSGGVQHIAIIR